MSNFRTMEITCRTRLLLCFPKSIRFKMLLYLCVYLRVWLVVTYENNLCKLSLLVTPRFCEYQVIHLLKSIFHHGIAIFQSHNRKSSKFHGSWGANEEFLKEFVILW